MGPRLNPFSQKITALLAAGAVLWGPVGDARAERGFWEERRAARRTGMDVSPARESFRFELPGLSRGGGPAGAGTLEALVLPHADLRAPVPADGARPVIYLLRDVHAHHGAQRNASALLRALQAGRGMALVGVEGAAGPVETARYRALPDARLRADIADAFLKEDMIGGAEHAAWVSEAPLDLWGVEDRTLYQANVEAFRRGLPAQAQTRAALARLRRELIPLKAAAYSEALKALERAADGYRAGTLGLGDYLAQLSPSEDAPHARRFLRAWALEKAVDFPRAEVERRRLAQALASKLSPPQLDALAREGLLYREGRMTVARFHETLRAACRTAGADLGAHPALARYIDYVQAAESVDKDALWRELRALERRAWDARLVTPRQEELRALDRDAELADGLAAFAMTPEDWAEAAPRLAELEALPSRQARLSGAAGAAEPFHLAPFADFCRLALARNAAFVDALMARMTASGLRSAAILAGGFHAEGLEALFRARGTDAVVLTPRIDGDMDGSYLDLLSREAAPLEALFLPEAITLKPALRSAAEPLGGRGARPMDDAYAALAAARGGAATEEARAALRGLAGAEVRVTPLSGAAPVTLSRVALGGKSVEVLDAPAEPAELPAVRAALARMDRPVVLTVGARRMALARPRRQAVGRRASALAAAPRRAAHAFRAAARAADRRPGVAAAAIAAAAGDAGTGVLSAPTAAAFHAFPIPMRGAAFGPGLSTKEAGDRAQELLRTGIGVSVVNTDLRVHPAVLKALEEKGADDPILWLGKALQDGLDALQGADVREVSEHGRTLYRALSRPARLTVDVEDASPRVSQAYKDGGISLNRALLGPAFDLETLQAALPVFLLHELAHKVLPPEKAEEAKLLPVDLFLTRKLLSKARRNVAALIRPLAAAGHMDGFLAALLLQAATGGDARSLVVHRKQGFKGVVAAAGLTAADVDADEVRRAIEAAFGPAASPRPDAAVTKPDLSSSSSPRARGRPKKEPAPAPVSPALTGPQDESRSSENLRSFLQRTIPILDGGIRKRPWRNAVEEKQVDLSILADPDVSTDALERLTWDVAVHLKEEIRRLMDAVKDRHHITKAALVGRINRESGASQAWTYPMVSMLLNEGSRPKDPARLLRLHADVQAARDALEKATGGGGPAGTPGLLPLWGGLMRRPGLRELPDLQFAAVFSALEELFFGPVLVESAALLLSAMGLGGLEARAAASVLSLAAFLGWHAAQGVMGVENGALTGHGRPLTRADAPRLAALAVLARGAYLLPFVAGIDGPWGALAGLWLAAWVHGVESARALGGRPPVRPLLRAAASLAPRTAVRHRVDDTDFSKGFRLILRSDDLNHPSGIFFKKVEEGPFLMRGEDRRFIQARRKPFPPLKSLRDVVAEAETQVEYLDGQGPFFETAGAPPPRRSIADDLFLLIRLLNPLAWPYAWAARRNAKAAGWIAFAMGLWEEEIVRGGLTALLAAVPLPFLGAAEPWVRMTVYAVLFAAVLHPSVFRGRSGRTRRLPPLSRRRWPLLAVGLALGTAQVLGVDVFWLGLAHGFYNLAARRRGWILAAMGDEDAAARREAVLKSARPFAVVNTELRFGEPLLDALRRHGVDEPELWLRGDLEKKLEVLRSLDDRAAVAHGKALFDALRRFKNPPVAVDLEDLPGEPFRVRPGLITVNPALLERLTRPEMEAILGVFLLDGLSRLLPPVEPGPAEGAAAKAAAALADKLLLAERIDPAALAREAGAFAPFEGFFADLLARRIINGVTGRRLDTLRKKSVDSIIAEAAGKVGRFHGEQLAHLREALARLLDDGRSKDAKPRRETIDWTAGLTAGQLAPEAAAYAAYFEGFFPAAEEEWRAHVEAVRAAGEKRDQKEIVQARYRLRKLFIRLHGEGNLKRARPPRPDKWPPGFQMNKTYPAEDTEKVKGTATIVRAAAQARAASADMMRTFVADAAAFMAEWMGPAAWEEHLRNAAADFSPLQDPFALPSALEALAMKLYPAMQEAVFAAMPKSGEKASAFVERMNRAHGSAGDWTMNAIYSLTRSGEGVWEPAKLLRLLRDIKATRQEMAAPAIAAAVDERPEEPEIKRPPSSRPPPSPARRPEYARKRPAAAMTGRIVQASVDPIDPGVLSSAPEDRELLSRVLDRGSHDVLATLAERLPRGHVHVHGADRVEAGAGRRVLRVSVRINRALHAFFIAVHGEDAADPFGRAAVTPWATLPWEKIEPYNVVRLPPHWDGGTFVTLGGPAEGGSAPLRKVGGKRSAPGLLPWWGAAIRRLQSLGLADRRIVRSLGMAEEVLFGPVLANGVAAALSTAGIRPELSIALASVFSLALFMAPHLSWGTAEVKDGALTGGRRRLSGWEAVVLFLIFSNIRTLYALLHIVFPALGHWAAVPGMLLLGALHGEWNALIFAMEARAPGPKRGETAGGALRRVRGRRAGRPLPTSTPIVLYDADTREKAEIELPSEYFNPGVMSSIDQAARRMADEARRPPEDLTVDPVKIEEMPASPPLAPVLITLPVSVPSRAKSTAVPPPVQLRKPAGEAAAAALQAMTFWSPIYGWLARGAEDGSRAASLGAAGALIFGGLMEEVWLRWLFTGVMARLDVLSGLGPWAPWGRAAVYAFLFATVLHMRAYHGREVLARRLPLLSFRRWPLLLLGSVMGAGQVMEAGLLWLGVAHAAYTLAARRFGWILGTANLKPGWNEGWLITLLKKDMAAIPRMSREELKTLVPLLLAGDRKAFNAFVGANLWISLAVTSRYKRRPDYLDLVQEANMAVMRAALTPSSMTGPFQTYAYKAAANAVFTWIQGQRREKRDERKIDPWDAPLPFDGAPEDAGGAPDPASPGRTGMTLADVTPDAGPMSWDQALARWEAGRFSKAFIDSFLRKLEAGAHSEGPDGGRRSVTVFRGRFLSEPPVARAAIERAVGLTNDKLRELEKKLLDQFFQHVKETGGESVEDPAAVYRGFKKAKGWNGLLREEYEEGGVTEASAAPLQVAQPSAGSVERGDVKVTGPAGQVIKLLNADLRKTGQMSTAELNALVPIYKAGDRKALGTFVRAYMWIPINAARRYRSDPDHLDLIQEANIALFRAAENYEPANGTFKTFAYTYALNAVSGYLAKRGRLKRNDRGFLSWDKPLYEDGTTLGDITPDTGPLSFERILSRKDAEEFSSTFVDSFLQKIETGIYWNVPDGGKRSVTVFKERILTERPRTLESIGDEFGVKIEIIRKKEEELFAKFLLHVAQNGGERVADPKTTYRRFIKSKNVSKERERDRRYKLEKKARLGLTGWALRLAGHRGGGSIREDTAVKAALLEEAAHSLIGTNLLSAVLSLGLGWLAPALSPDAAYWAGRAAAFLASNAVFALSHRRAVLRGEDGWIVPADAAAPPRPGPYFAMGVAFRAPLLIPGLGDALGAAAAVLLHLSWNSPLRRRLGELLGVPGLRDAPLAMAVAPVSAAQAAEAVLRFQVQEARATGNLGYLALFMDVPLTDLTTFALGRDGAPAAHDLIGRAAGASLHMRWPRSFGGLRRRQADFLERFSASRGAGPWDLRFVEELERGLESLKSSPAYARWLSENSPKRKGYAKLSRRSPILTAAQEERLFRAFQDAAGDRKRAYLDLLTRPILRSVIPMANDHGRGDRTQDGILGLFHVLGLGKRTPSRHDPAKGSLANYAHFRMMNAIKKGEAMRRRSLPLPDYLWNWRNALERKAGAPLAEIDPDLLDGKDRERLGKVKAAFSGIEVDVPFDDDATAPSPGINDESVSAVDAELMGEAVDAFLAELLRKEGGERRAAIFRARVLTSPPVALRVLGERFGISHPRVRQVEEWLFKEFFAHLARGGVFRVSDPAAAYDRFRRIQEKAVMGRPGSTSPSTGLTGWALRLAGHRGAGAVSERYAARARAIEDAAFPLPLLLTLLLPFWMEVSGPQIFLLRLAVHAAVEGLFALLHGRVYERNAAGRIVSPRAADWRDRRDYVLLGAGFRAGFLAAWAVDALAPRAGEGLATPLLALMAWGLNAALHRARNAPPAPAASTETAGVRLEAAALLPPLSKPASAHSARIALRLAPLPAAGADPAARAALYAPDAAAEADFLESLRAAGRADAARPPSPRRALVWAARAYRAGLLPAGDAGPEPRARLQGFMDAYARARRAVAPSPRDRLSALWTALKRTLAAAFLRRPLVDVFHAPLVRGPDGGLRLLEDERADRWLAALERALAAGEKRGVVLLSDEDAPADEVRAAVQSRLGARGGALARAGVIFKADVTGTDGLIRVEKVSARAAGRGPAPLLDVYTLWDAAWSPEDLLRSLARVWLIWAGGVADATASLAAAVEAARLVQVMA